MNEDWIGYFSLMVREIVFVLKLLHFS